MPLAQGLFELFVLDFFDSGHPHYPVCFMKYIVGSVRVHHSTASCFKLSFQNLETLDFYKVSQQMRELRLCLHSTVWWWCRLLKCGLCLQCSVSADQPYGDTHTHTHTIVEEQKRCIVIVCSSASPAIKWHKNH